MPLVAAKPQADVERLSRGLPHRGEAVAQELEQHLERPTAHRWEAHEVHEDGHGAAQPCEVLARTHRLLAALEELEATVSRQQVLAMSTMAKIYNAYTVKLMRRRPQIRL